MKPFLVLSVILTLHSFRADAFKTQTNSNSNSNNNNNQNNELSNSNSHAKKRGIPFNYPLGGNYYGGAYGSPGQYGAAGINQYLPYQQAYGQQFPQQYPQQSYYGQHAGVGLPTAQYPSYPQAYPQAAQAFSPQAFSPQAFSPQAFSPQALSPQFLSPHALTPHALAPHSLTPQTLSPNSLSPHSFSPHLFSQFAQTQFPTQQFSTPYSLSQYNPSSALTQSLISQIPKTFGSALSQRAGFQFGFQQGKATPAAIQQNEVESSHEVQSPKSHISSSDQQTLVPPESEINQYDDRKPGMSRYVSGNIGDDADKPTHSYSSSSKPNKDSILKHFNIPKFLFTDYTSDDDDPNRSNGTDRLKVTRSSAFAPSYNSYNSLNEEPRKGFVKIHFGNTKIEY